MTNAILLCAAMLAADDPAQVQAKVLYGTAAEQQHRADIELWISQAVAKTGSPLAQPYTSWIALTEKEQELYSWMQGGRIIKGKVSEKNGKFHVEITGFKIKPLQQSVVLTAGERRVVKLTDYPAPNNVFIALEAPVSEKATLEAKVGREGSKVRFSTEGDKTIIDITSEFGIDKATISRKSYDWPKTILVRLHLGGLESFKAGGDGVDVEWSVLARATMRYARRW